MRPTSGATLVATSRLPPNSTIVAPSVPRSGDPAEVVSNERARTRTLLNVGDVSAISIASTAENACQEPISDLGRFISAIIGDRMTSAWSRKRQEASGAATT